MIALNDIFLLSKIKKNIPLKKKILILIKIFLTLSSCYTTKHIEPNQTILQKNNILINNETGLNSQGILKSDIKTIIKQHPNKKILGIIPFHLWLYNLSNPLKTNWTNNYLRKIGEKPVVINRNLIQKSELQIKSYLENNGYFNASVKSFITNKKNKSYVTYDIKPRTSYLIDQINYNNISDTTILNLIKSTNRNKHLKMGDRFTYSILNHEIEEIETILNNNGYFKFSKDLIYINADSTIDRKINLDFHIKNLNNDTNYEIHTIKNINIYIDASTSTNDTIMLNGYNFFLNEDAKKNLKLNNIIELIDFQKNHIYSKKEVESTYRKLSDLRYFKKINIEFEETKEKSDINCNIFLESPTQMYYSLETEIKRSADEGNLGVSGYFQFGNNNLFSGGENLNSKIKLSLENRYDNFEQNQQIFNTKEVFYELSLRIPKLVIPNNIKQQLINSYQKSTNISFSVSKRQRPDFSSKVISQKIGYSWSNTDFKKHQFNLFELSFSEISSLNEFIQNELSQNPYLSEQFEDRFIPSTNYIFTYNNQKIYKNTNYTFFKTKIETSGNIISSLSPLINLNKNADDKYLIFNKPFTQYIRFDLDFRKYFYLDSENQLVFRNFIGIAYAHTNSDELPIQKQFFSGGVNSVRAWEAFNLGPGSYDQLNNYATGDIKLEFNLEYRFKVINKIKSALFIDSGNIWSIKNDPREGSVFKLNKFINDLAIGFGYGFRYDFDFFIVRLDIATRLKDPSFNQGNQWIKQPFKENFRYNLAIGYPF
ncbi:MAG: hypothetical protein CMP65_00365 [Flavobacteriales bacterium]|nr:hypothetical protein [Flavobacteriales bacterium]